MIKISKAKIQSWFSPLVTRPHLLQFQRWVYQQAHRFNTEHKLSVWLQLDDPYSYLLLQKLPELKQNSNIEIELFFIQQPLPSVLVEAEKWRDWSYRDANALAELYLLESPGEKTVEKDLQPWYLALQQNRADLTTLLEIFGAFYQGTAEPDQWLKQQVNCHQRQQIAIQLQENLQLLEKSGHYLPATIIYDGECYWGIDRLNHLQQRLFQLGVIEHDQSFDLRLAREQQWAEQLSAAMPEAVTVYLSLRSPYSWLLFYRLRKLVLQKKIILHIKPLLPMVMRGLPVPKVKKFYILKDASREAWLQDIPFGPVCDPLGKGVENGYALWFECLQKVPQQADELLYRLMELAWAKGQDLADSRVLLNLLRQMKLEQQIDLDCLQRKDWLNLLTENREAVSKQGLWGVPVLQQGEQMAWGQDRIWQVMKSL